MVARERCRETSKERRVARENCNEKGDDENQEKGRSELKIRKKNERRKPDREVECVEEEGLGNHEAMMVRIAADRENAHMQSCCTARNIISKEKLQENKTGEPSSHLLYHIKKDE